MYQITKNFSSGTQNVVKNISSEVVRECVNQGVNATPEVAALLVVLLSINPDNGLSLTSQNNQLNLEEFVKKCVRSFLDKTSTSIRTLEMQEYCTQSSIDPQRILKKYQKNIEVKALPIMKEIIEADHPDQEEKENLFKKIIIYINMTYLLGSASNPKIMTETTNALKSVMSRSDLVHFFELNKKARHQQLQHIQEIVCGIRVFNKDAGHCGEGIRDMQADITYAFRNTMDNLTENLESVTEKVKRLTDVMSTLHQMDPTLKQMKFNETDNVTEENLDYLKGILIMSLQHECFIKKLLKTVNQLKLEIDRKLDEFRKVLDILHDIVQYRTAVPTEKVFPHFSQVSVLWRSLLDCIYLLIEANKTNEYLSKISENTQSYENILYLIEENLNYQENLQVEPLLSIQSLSQEIKKMNCEYVGPHHQLTVHTSPVSRFCPYIFIVSDGLLVPSKNAAGYLKYNDLLLSFSTLENARLFVSNVEDYFTSFIKTVRKHPELIVFFDIYDVVSSYHITKVKKDEEHDEIIRSDAEMQTELHPIPYYKDRDYTWNIWDLRRKAIQLANLKGRRTHSTQTNQSYYRLNANLQTVDPKANSCQTSCDAFTNIAKKDASSDCMDADKIVGTHAMAATLKNFYTVSYRLQKK